ncbi:minor capsid protein [Listeria seeligeri]|uniref:phage head morphogenesis protein n=1 Tax=Listeria seeligeri TaxID=1640 RepID=UPI0010DB98A3|nr:minor capsid protein [Listeria seeligeri]EAD3671820.1 phage head morphogenesis protein [Listeria monocytogenes]EAH0733560.1 phage head morphogenesis protein [Listeria monocytogenes]EAH1481720.1 phage head morphogenesis protein [Listeria monocytogenes]EAH2076431.1 phage head morphogenesis protein [Listeria monocytogenes]EAH2240383.1 phage head morphogenesis protein [Listeria monocytogenes]
MAKKRVPVTRYPHNLEKSYKKQLVKLTTALSDMLLHEFDTNITVILKTSQNRADGLRGDGVSDAVQAVLNKVKALSFGLFNPSEKYSIASKHVRAVNTTSKAQIGNQLRSQGVDPTQSEPWLSEFMDASIAENVSYIGSISDDFNAKTEQIIMRGVKSGQSAKDMRDELVKQVGTSKNKAEFIATDQTGTIFGQMTAERHKKAGIPGFVWRDSGDASVRPAHHARNGNIYSYDDPSAPIPGTEYRCRCTAGPEFDESVIKASTNKRKEQEAEDNATLKVAFKEVAKAAQEAPNNIKELLSDNVTADSFEIARDVNIAYAYRPSSKKIIINPQNKAMKYYNKQEVLLHESGHLIDFAKYKSWENHRFKVATQIEKKVAKWDEIEELFKHEKWADDDYFSDICSGLTGNKIKGNAGHAASYWKQKGSVEKEIFANLFAMLAMNKQESLDMVRKQFPMIYGSFINMLEGELK